MADFANYTPGEYAKEHIRITPTTLADGRDFFYPVSYTHLTLPTT